ncbi:glycosyltransferase family 4 protein [Dictyobacter kobayashii]|uniref:glycosyltransferase family 4 protein n=1 Tax=Dictyobacter kobayashii TaxID=2014872 RepID=UPI001FEC9E75|nr:glycosyltransferase [Dictyobacter kobayashii]
MHSLSQALQRLPSELAGRVRLLIAGDGPLREEVKATIQHYKLEQACLLWGDTPASEVLSLLAISDIFLYTSTRGACFSMAMLEAMASRCAVIASTEPRANAQLLAEQRGIAVAANDVEQTSAALVQLIKQPELCQQMGAAARAYVAHHHSTNMFRRTLQRTTYWAELDTLLSE